MPVRENVNDGFGSITWSRDFTTAVSKLHLLRHCIAVFIAEMAVGTGNQYTPVLMPCHSAMVLKSTPFSIALVMKHRRSAREE